jgi:aromatic-L-amino-acid/L-tryptophan decarboxylase
MFPEVLMDAKSFREFGHQLIDWVADYRENIEKFPVMSRAAPGDIRRLLPAAAPVSPESFPEVLSDVDRVVLPGITHWNHPGFFAYFPSNMSLAPVLAEVLIAGLGAQGMSWQTSPAATELEEVMMDWLRQMVGLPPEFSGVIHDTASTASLCALLCARERSTGYGQNRGGLQAEPEPLVVYASDQSHSSVEKAALLAGFGKGNLRHIETDADHAMRADRLADAMVADRKAGRNPCAVVATTGATATTALDPVARIAEIAEEHGAWMHLDAAMAGSAMILPECRWMWAGVEAADSIVMNPHKWLGTGCDLSAYYVRDPQHLIRVMSTNPSYLRTQQDAEVKNFRDWGIPLGRRFRALKLWFLIREQGVAGLQARLRRDLENAQWLKEAVDAVPGWERLAPVHLQTVCVRHVPRGVQAEEAIAAHNLRIADAINCGGRSFLTAAVLKGRQMLRLSIGAEPTERRHVAALWKELQEAAARG